MKDILDIISNGRNIGGILGIMLGKVQHLQILYYINVQKM